MGHIMHGRVLLLTTPNSYRTRDYLDAAARLGIEAVVAVDYAPDPCR